MSKQKMQKIICIEANISKKKKKTKKVTRKTMKKGEYRVYTAEKENNACFYCVCSTDDFYF